MRFFIIALLFAVMPCCCQGVNYSLTENEYFSFAERKQFQTHLQQVQVYNLSYHSFDSTSVNGFLIKPVSELKKHPVIIYNRGGNNEFGMVSDSYIMMFLSKIAARGYIIIGSQLRGSMGSDGVDEFGGRDVNDVLCLLNIIDSLPYADTSKIGLIGWSRGVVTNFILLKKSERIKTAINIAGPSDLMKSRQKMFQVYRKCIPGYAQDSVTALKERSPVFLLESMRNKHCSLMFIQGDKDERVEKNNAVELYNKTQQLGLQSELLIYPNGSHSLREVWPDVIEKIDLWLHTHFSGG
ncbi:alpha/beta hydrolase family protein [Flavobacterium rhizosphaerae]|uniref:Prolyl oligopeptidase family serine peptidase n=1 Tax=Flavobacterium rhizosphaerae TaxID=3163298 RepID=A0ABW8Z2L9_9FLAO